jgi:hypothetical protein
MDKAFVDDFELSRTIRNGYIDRKPSVHAWDDGIPGSFLRAAAGLEAFIANFKNRQMMAEMTPPMIHQAVISSLLPSKIANAIPLTTHFVDSLIYPRACITREGEPEEVAPSAEPCPLGISNGSSAAATLELFRRLELTFGNLCKDFKRPELQSIARRIFWRATRRFAPPTLLGENTIFDIFHPICAS